MGWDITVLGKHNLDISTLENLALDLFRRFGFKIDYGYFAQEDYNNLLENNLQEGFVSSGSIDAQTYIGGFTLIDENYQHIKLLEKFGDDLLKKDEYWTVTNFEISDNPSQTEIENEKLQINKPHFYLNNQYQNFSLSIYNEVVDFDFYRYSAWTHYFFTICRKDYRDEDDFKRYRFKNMQLAIALCGNKLYYVSEEWDFFEDAGQGDKINYSWDNLELHIQEKAGDLLCSISEVFLNTCSSDHNYILSREEEFTAYYDDFEDLEKIELQKNNFGLGTLLD